MLPRFILKKLQEKHLLPGMLIITQVDTFLSFKITFVGHSNSPVKAVTTALSAPSDLKKKSKTLLSLTVQFC